MDRELDLRDSTVQNALKMTRKGRGSAVEAAQSQLSRTHCTPWGDPVGPQDPADNPNKPVEPGLRTNHFQNNETGPYGGIYRVPDCSPAHNHFQNSETEQRNGKMKLTTSRINDGDELFTPERSDPASVSRLGKVTSRINDGHDIFGPPTPNPRGPPPPRKESFQNRPTSGHIRGSQWLGYTNASLRAQQE